jgi:Histidine kinase-, DNA gyrase B-, and HSP90-like ATPase
MRSRSVVETVRSATESLAQNKKLALKTAVAKPLPIGLGDEQRLTQVLLNLVGNAIKFTDGGEVCVSAKAVNDHFTVSVADTGPGIPQDEQHKIFEQFHQVDSSLTKAAEGRPASYESQGVGHGHCPLGTLQPRPASRGSSDHSAHQRQRPRGYRALVSDKAEGATIHLMDSSGIIGIAEAGRARRHCREYALEVRGWA